MAKSEILQEKAPKDPCYQCGILPEGDFSTTLACLVLLGILPDNLVETIDWEIVGEFLKTDRKAN